MTLIETSEGSVGAICPENAAVSPTSKIDPGRTPIGWKKISTSLPRRVSSAPPDGPPEAPWNGGMILPPVSSSAGR